jgi:pimeloyl-ACP methyl ester carboxylesterase
MKIISFVFSLNFLLSGLSAQNKIDSLFTETEVELQTPTGVISGTLTIPDNAKTSPIVIIIAGSGPTDRNCNSPLGIQTNAYKMLSADFANKGISSLRFDKRGIGKSKSAMTSESDLRFETYVNDVVAWISKFKPDTRFSKIFLLGHSEGSLIGMIAANKIKISGLISIAGVGISADKLLQEQLKDKLPQQLLDESNKILDSLLSGKTVSNVNPNLMAIYRPSVQPYMISWIKYDPGIEIKKLKIPVLIIQGSTDIQVHVDNAKILATSKSDAKLLIIDKMNHIMKESDTDLQKNMATYRNPDLPLISGLVDEIVDFIKTK